MNINKTPFRSTKFKYITDKGSCFVFEYNGYRASNKDIRIVKNIRESMIGKEECRLLDEELAKSLDK